MRRTTSMSLTERGRCRQTWVPAAVGPSLHPFGQVAPRRCHQRIAPLARHVAQQAQMVAHVALVDERGHRNLQRCVAVVAQQPAHRDEHFDQPLGHHQVGQPQRREHDALEGAHQQHAVGAVQRLEGHRRRAIVRDPSLKLPSMTRHRARRPIAATRHGARCRCARPAETASADAGTPPPRRAPRRAGGHVAPSRSSGTPTTCARITGTATPGWRAGVFAPTLSPARAARDRSARSPASAVEPSTWSAETSWRGSATGGARWPRAARAGRRPGRSSIRRYGSPSARTIAPADGQRKLLDHRRAVTAHRRQQHVRQLELPGLAQVHRKAVEHLLRRLAGRPQQPAACPAETQVVAAASRRCRRPRVARDNLRSAVARTPRRQRRAPPPSRWPAGVPTAAARPAPARGDGSHRAPSGRPATGATPAPRPAGPAAG